MTGWIAAEGAPAPPPAVVVPDARHDLLGDEPYVVEV